MKVPILMDLENLQDVKRENGIYFLFKGEKIVYIGHSINVYTRILEHIIENKKTFDYIKAVYNSDILKTEILEVILISEVRPKYNKLVVNDSRLYFYSLPNSVSKKYNYDVLASDGKYILEKINEIDKKINIRGV
jgi:excinuclease UvrABC nuclease subunit